MCLAAASSGYGFSVGRVRPCDFSLYSFMNPIGLSLLPSNYQAALTFAVDNAQSNPVLNKSIEHNDVGFYGAVAKGSYLVKYNDELMRLVFTCIFLYFQVFSCICFVFACTNQQF